MGTLAASLDRLDRSVASLDAAICEVADRLATQAHGSDSAATERHTALRREVLAAIAELDQIIGAKVA